MGVFRRQGRGLLPALRGIAPEDAAGGDGYRRPAPRMVFGQLPGAVSAQREPGQVGAIRVEVELGCLPVQSLHGQRERLRVGPVVGQRTLRHHDDEGPALRVVAHLLGQANLRLPHPLRAALPAPVEEQDHRPLLVVVAPPLLGQIDLEAVGGPIQYESAVQKARLLRGLLVVEPAAAKKGLRLRGCNRAGQQQAGRDESQKTDHAGVPSHYIRPRSNGRRGPMGRQPNLSPINSVFLSSFLTIFLRPAVKQSKRPAVRAHEHT
jgi:hypothetical protein